MRGWDRGATAELEGDRDWEGVRASPEATGVGSSEPRATIGSRWEGVVGTVSPIFFTWLCGEI